MIDPVVAPSLGSLRAETTLAGHALWVEVTPGPRGHGVVDAQLNGAPLPLVTEPNAYRDGGARVAWAAMAPLWTAGMNTLSLRIA